MSNDSMISEDVDTFCEDLHLYDVSIILKEYASKLSNINEFVNSSIKSGIKSNIGIIIPYINATSDNKIDIYINGMAKFISQINIDVITNIIGNRFLNEENIDYLVSLPIISYFLDIIKEITNNLSSIILLLDDKFELTDTSFTTHNIKYINLIVDKINHVNNQYALLNIFLRIYENFEDIYFRLIYMTSSKYVVKTHISQFLYYGQRSLENTDYMIDEYVIKYDDNIQFLNSIISLIQDTESIFELATNDVLINKLNNKIQGLKLCLSLYSKNKDDILEDINSLKRIKLLSTTICEHVRKISGFDRERKHSGYDSESSSEYD